MPESPKAELVFRFTRDADDTFVGYADLVEPQTGESLRPQLEVAVQQPEWVQFVVAQIRAHADVEKVSFRLKNEGVINSYRLDDRTLEKIRDESLSAEDITL